MTPLDRFFQQYPLLKDLVFMLDEYLAVIIGVPVALLILFILYWTFFLAPRKARMILASLEKQGYTPVAPDDPQLANAIARLTPLIHHAYELTTVTKTSAWRAEAAYGRSGGRSNRYFAHIRRSVHRSPPDGSYTVGPEFTIAFFERCPLPFGQDVHVAGDHYTLDPGYGLQKVASGLAEPLASLYVFHTRDGVLDTLPSRLEKALAESAILLSISAERPRLNDPFLFYARFKFTAEGWGLISNEHIHRQEKLDALVKVVDNISNALR